MNDSEIYVHVPDLAGEHYNSTLQRLHEVLCPKTYLEIGVFTGDSLKMARCASIAIDPMFQIAPGNLEGVFAKPALHFFQTGSDEFFSRHSPSKIFGSPIDMAFLDGMHRCEYLLRDFINTERHCKRNSIIALHDCLPVEVGIATRVQSQAHAVAPHRTGWWAGDVWRTALLLRRVRPDLDIIALDSSATGLMLITNLDPGNTTLFDNYSRYAKDMLSWRLEEIGIQSLFSEMNIRSSSTLQAHEEITRSFWL